MNELFIDIHTHHSDRKRAIVNLFHDGIPSGSHFFSKALHPWHIETLSFASQLIELEEHLHTDCVIAIGECGLDAFASAAPDIQEEVFRWHIRQSEELGKPLIIHCVKSYNRLIEIKKELSPAQAWIIHGYRSGNMVLQQLLHHGFFISIGTILLTEQFKLKEYMKKIPVSRLFFESDESATDVQAIYEFCSEYLNIPLAEFTSIISDNFASVFKKHAGELE